MILKRNIGGIDRALRVSFSLLMLYFGFSDNTIITDQMAGVIIGIIGLASLLVAVVGICPLYTVIKLNTLDSTDKS